jgi:hypothetical protein
LQERSYLHKRHRLSHRQIDVAIGKESGKNFLDEKLRSLMLVNDFLAIVRIFNSKGIFFVALKGPLLSQRIYDDATVRISHDIDILIRKADFNSVYELMLSHGYKLSREEDLPVGRDGECVMPKSTYQISFCRSGSKFTIDIHWQLFDYLPFSHSRVSRIIEQNVTELTFYGERVRRFSLEFELIYLMIRGSKHGWCCLKWLVDIKDYPTHELDREKFVELVSLMSANKVLIQTNFLLKRYFNKKLPFKTKRRVNSFVLRYPLDCINSKLPENQSAKSRLRKFIYNFLMFSPWQGLWTLHANVKSQLFI